MSRRVIWEMFGLVGLVVGVLATAVIMQHLGTHYFLDNDGVRVDLGGAPIDSWTTRTSVLVLVSEPDAAPSNVVWQSFVVQRVETAPLDIAKLDSPDSAFALIVREVPEKAEYRLLSMTIKGGHPVRLKVPEGLVTLKRHRVYRLAAPREEAYIHLLFDNGANEYFFLGRQPQSAQ